jgi:dTDP-4-amino-4,6-dideoxygalactose transaminase
MIPRHEPSFTVGEVLNALLFTRGPNDVGDIEGLYARTLGMPHAILLPSARAGISWALRSTVAPGEPVVAPAFTCRVVHEAVLRAGCEPRILDLAQTGFLLDDGDLRSTSASGVILCEMYGHTYDLARIDAGPKIRIVDMAMSVPDAALLSRLAANDFGVISFGLGKCAYSGWGAMGFTRNEALAEAVRALRDANVVPSSGTLTAQRALETLTRTVLHERSIYGLARSMVERWAGLAASVRRRQQPAGSESALPWAWRDRTSLPAEWRLPTCGLDRALDRRNLERSSEFCDRRRAQVRRYHQALRGTPGLTLPPPSDDVLSHYTVRVKAGIRSELRARLWKLGIDTGTFFGFPHYLDAARFPRAVHAAEEVLNLPVGPRLTLADVDAIAASLSRSLADLAPP